MALLPDSGGVALYGNLSSTCGLFSFHRSVILLFANLSANGALTDVEHMLPTSNSPVCMYFMPFHDTVALLLACTFLVALLCSAPCGPEVTVLLFALLCTSIIWEVSVPVLLIAWRSCCWNRRTLPTQDAPSAPQLVGDNGSFKGTEKEYRLQSDRMLLKLM